MPEKNMSRISTPELFLPASTENNHTELYIDGPDILSMLLREIKKARHFIHIQVMLFYSDEAGFKIAEALAEKAKEGVDVRVMSDSDMSNIVRAIEKYRSSGTSNFSDLKNIFSTAGVKFVASDKESYKMWSWDEKRADLLKKGVPEEFLVMQDTIQEGINLNANVFDHRKVLIFDGETAVVTGSNIGNKYLYEQNPAESDSSNLGERWHDGAILLKGPCCTTLNKHFASKWMVRGGDLFDYQKHFRRNDSYGTDRCTIYSYFPGMEVNHIRNYYLQKIKKCEGNFIIENPYINDELFSQELASLEKEQAEKIIIINPYKAKGNDYMQNESAIKCRMWEPSEKGVTLYSYYKRMTHWKIALDVAAEEVFIGSYNLNHRSAFHDFELNVLVESQQLAVKVKEMLDDDISKSSKINHKDEIYRHPKNHPSCFLLNVTDYFE